MKVTPFTRDLLKAYREDREQARQISASFREKTKADIKPVVAVPTSQGKSYRPSHEGAE